MSRLPPEINKVILIGNATHDAKLRQAKSGRPVSNIRLATNRVIGGEDRSQFHMTICWDKLAETTGTYVKKGAPLYVEGRLEYRTFQDEEGKLRGVCKTVSSDVGFLSRRPPADGACNTMSPPQIANG